MRQNRRIQCEVLNKEKFSQMMGRFEAFIFMPFVYTAHTELKDSSHTSLTQSTPNSQISQGAQAQLTQNACKSSTQQKKSNASY